VRYSTKLFHEKSTPISRTSILDSWGDMWLTIYWRAYKSLEESEPTRLIWNAVQFRIPSKISGETICLGSLLGFDQEKMKSLLSISAQEPRKRMQKFLLLQRFFPIDLLFVRGTKFTDKPFRWAPTSFIFRGHTDDDIDVLETNFSVMKGPLCIADKCGLVVFLAGYRLSFDPTKVEK
jgi:hypothetical protein